jgi:hypothetical protein
MGKQFPLLNVKDLNEDFQFLNDKVIRMISSELVHQREAPPFEKLLWSIKNIRNLKCHHKRKYLSESFLRYAFEVLYLSLLIIDTN